VVIGKRPLKFQVGLGAPRDVDPTAPFDLAFQSNGSEPLVINWKASPFITLSCEDCPNPRAVASQSGMVYLTLVDVYGCRVEDSLAIRVAPIREVYIPDAFSPNGDGHNDVFFVQGRSGSKIVVLRIFDRWGGVLFERQDAPINLPEYGWDPTLTKHLMEGVYLFQTVVEFPDGVRKSYQGSFQLLR
jgi:gliding motility-associated-like protein